MKRQTIIPIVSCLLILGIVGGCKSKFDEKKYLTKILKNLEQMKSVSYTHATLFSRLGDTVPLPGRPPLKQYYYEFANPADTIIGISLVNFILPDTTLYAYYNGDVCIIINDRNKTISIDTVNTGRPIKSFFNRTKNIINYALTTNDSILKEFQDFGDSLLFRLIIYNDRQVMLDDIKPRYMFPGDEIKITQYDVWINKSTGIPFKHILRFPNMNHYWEEVSDVQINTMNIEDIIPSRYFPADYDIIVRGAIVVSPLDLLGKQAPDWTLSDYNNESFALNDFTSKIILLQFSGIGCGPCHAAIPFLNQLEIDYRDKSFEVIRVECWNTDIERIKSYISTNDIKYKFLLKDEDIEKNYNMPLAPTFFILDSNKTIQFVQRGYSSNREIREAIEKLL